MMMPTSTRASASVQGRLTNDGSQTATRPCLSVWDASAHAYLAFVQSARIHSWTTVLVSEIDITRHAHSGYVTFGYFDCLSKLPTHSLLTPPL